MAELLTREGAQRMIEGLKAWTSEVVNVKITGDTSAQTAALKIMEELNANSYDIKGTRAVSVTAAGGLAFGMAIDFGTSGKIMFLDYCANNNSAKKIVLTRMGEKWTVVFVEA